MNGMSKGSVVVIDPVMQYINALGPGEKPKSVESLLNPGLQIVSMSRDVAKTLQVTWDPDITEHMESANKTLEKTLGLAKNVPFVFGPITVYLQVHVIEKVAYWVLLG